MSAGTYVPPLSIFPRKCHSPQLEKGGPLAAVYKCTLNGWTIEQIFLKWLNHFKDFVKPTQEKPVLLILDNHNSHATLKAYNFCKKNNIIMLLLPPHSSHRMQPLDVTFFGPLKGAYHKECDLFIKSHNLQKITPYEIAGLFNKAYIRIASVEKGISGFQATGIFLINPGKFTDEDFIDFDKTLVEKSAIPINQVVERQDIEEAIPSTSSASPTTTSMVMNADTESSNVVVHENPISRSEYQENMESFSSLLSNLSPLPSIQKNKGIGNGRKGPQKQHSEILTATPLKVIFEEKTRKRNEKILKGKENKKKKTNNRRNQVKKSLFSSNSSDSSIDERESEYDEAEVYLSDPSKTSDQSA